MLIPISAAAADAAAADVGDEDAELDFKLSAKYESWNK
jgi:hypothetical protein